MKQYLDTLKLVMEQGKERGDRTGTGVISKFGHQVRYDLNEGFPLLTTKDMSNLFPKIFHELMWFIKGETNIKYLVDRDVGIWNRDAYRWYKQKRLGKTFLTYKDFIYMMKHDESFAKEYGDLGKIYGKQWTDFGGHEEHTPLGEEYSYGINQLDEVIKLLKSDPNSRRILVSAWNPYDQKEMALPPCHVLFQFYVEDGKLSCQLYQRSADMFLGVPFNIASYALLTHMIAKIVGLGVGEFIHTFGDFHIYSDHLEVVKEQLERTPLKLPEIKFADKGYEKLTDFKAEDISLVNYKSYGKLTAKVSVGE